MYAQQCIYTVDMQIALNNHEILLRKKCISREEISCLTSCLFYLCCQYVIVVLEAGNRGSIIHYFPHAPFRREEHWFAALFGFFWKIHLKVGSFCLKSIKQWQVFECWCATRPEAVRRMQIWNKSKELYLWQSLISCSMQLQFHQSYFSCCGCILCSFAPFAFRSILWFWKG